MQILIHYEKKKCFAIGLATQSFNCKDHLQPVLSNGWPLAAAACSRSQPQIGYGCGQDFDQRAAAGGCAPSTTGYAHSRYVKTTPCFAK
jgi:hypothetical protein